jgi:hypothetical protein
MVEEEWVYLPAAIDFLYVEGKEGDLIRATAPRAA